MTQQMTKEDALAMVLAAITKCTVPGADTSAVIIIINNETDNVNVYGINIAHEDLAAALVDASEHVDFVSAHDYANRTIN